MHPAPFLRRHQCAFALIAVLLTAAASAASAQQLAEVEGVTFTTPVELQAQPVLAGSEPMVKLWKDTGDTISVTVFVSAADGSALAKELLQDWPSVGRSFVKAFGDVNAKALSEAYGAECSFSGAPVLRDMSRAMMGTEATTTCETLPTPTVLKSRLILVQTRSKEVLFKIDALPAADATAAKLVTDLWKSIVVADSVRVASSEPSPVDVVERAWTGSVSGGHGVHFVNYDTIRPAALVGEAIGTLLSGLVFGWLSTMGLMRLGVRPPSAVVVSQLMYIALNAWSHEQDGNWTLSPAMWLLNALAAAVLLVPAQRRWRRNEPATPLS